MIHTHLCHPLLYLFGWNSKGKNAMEKFCGNLCVCQYSKPYWNKRWIAVCLHMLLRTLASDRKSLTMAMEKDAIERE